MPYNPKLVSYVNAGLSKGFREDHIASVLRKHGHSEADIREAFSHTQPPVSNKGMVIGIGVFAVFIVVSLLTWGLFSHNTPSAAVTGNVVGIQETADKLALLQDKADKQQAELDEALAKANDAELSAQEKDKLMTQMQTYYDTVKQEREGTRNALFDLWTFLFSKE